MVGPRSEQSKKRFVIPRRRNSSTRNELTVLIYYGGLIPPPVFYDTKNASAQAYEDSALQGEMRQHFCHGDDRLRAYGG